MTDPRFSSGPRAASTPPWRDLVPFAFGALTMVATSLALATHTSSAALHQVWVGFVPVGAIAAGAGAASGYYLGALVCGCRPPAFGATLMRVSILPVYAASSFWLSSRGQTLHAVSLDPSGFNSATVTGLLIYPLVILAGLGFAVGAAAVTSLLDAPVHCQRCRRYLPRPGDRTATWPACEFEPHEPFSFGLARIRVGAGRHQARPATRQEGTP